MSHFSIQQTDNRWCPVTVLLPIARDGGKMTGANEQNHRQSSLFAAWLLAPRSPERGLEIQLSAAHSILGVSREQPAEAINQVMATG
jgi:hypothetical protein